MTVVDDIKDQLDIVETISEHLSLKKAGQNYKGLCPFHGEKTPSFVVSPERQIWHCFGCGKGGDIFGFVKEIEGVEFKESLKILADKAGIELKPENPKVKSEKNKSMETHEKATELFHYLLLQKVGKNALNYLKKRTVIEKTIKTFKIGYAPDSYDTLIKFFNKHGYKENELLKAGLVSSNEQGRVYDKFRGRLMFPIRNPNGETIAFGGRILTEDTKAPKYLNSPQTLIYDKSNTIYNLNQAKESIRKKDQLIIVEGYMDVIASWQAGVQNVIASSGTALTEAQLKIIKRYTQNLFLAFDSDSAGAEATKRGIELALQNGFEIKIINLGGYKDPDELIKKGIQKWEQAIKQATPVMDFYFTNAFKKFQERERIKPKAQKIISTEILPLINNLQSKIDQDHFLSKLSDEINIETKILREEMEKTLPPQKNHAIIPNDDGLNKKVKTNKNKTQISLEDYLIGIMLTTEKWQETISKHLNKEDYLSSLLKKLFTFIQKNPNQTDLAFIKKKLDLNNDEGTELGLILVKTEEIIRKSDKPLDQEEIVKYINKLKTESLLRQRKGIQHKLRKLKTTQDKKSAQELNRKIDEINKTIFEIEKK